MTAILVGPVGGDARQAVPLTDGSDGTLVKIVGSVRAGITQPE